MAVPAGAAGDHADHRAIIRTDAMGMQDLVAQASFIVVTHQQLMQQGSAMAESFTEQSILMTAQVQVADGRHQGIETGKIAQNLPDTIGAESQLTIDVYHKIEHRHQDLASGQPRRGIRPAICLTIPFWRRCASWLRHPYLP